MFFITGLLCLINAIKNIVLQLNIKNWTIGECTILEKEQIKEYAFVNYIQVESVVPIIYFSYKIKNIEYVSDTIGFNVDSSSSSKKYNKIYNNCVIGNNYKCYINPKKFHQAVLESETDWEYFRFYVFFGFFFWGCIVSNYIFK